MPANPYNVLGVQKGASADDIKKAYRKLAHQYHPDKKGGDEAKFKEVNEAYQTLSDPDKKARYDRFGHMGGAGGGAQGYQDFNFDFGGGGGGFESIFDMFTGGSAGSPRRAVKGEDLHLEVKVAPADLGKQKVYEFQAFNACAACSGTGAKSGKLKTCPTCHGQGRVQKAVRTPFGTFAQVGACSECDGDGQVPEHVCDVCSGIGRAKGKRTLEVRLPAGIPDRYLMAFPQEGNAGPKGVPPGDLLVTLRMK